MRVTLIRHGEAGDDAPRDEQRALTETGRADVRRVGRALARRGARFGAVVSSPLVRAVQTAELTVAAMDLRVRVTISDTLIPEGQPSAVIALLAGLARQHKAVALVAHEPILSRVAAALLGVARFPSLRKAEALRIRLPEMKGATGAGSAQFDLDAPKAIAANPGVLRWRIDPHTGRRKRA